MKELIENFSKQLSEALEIGTRTKFKNNYTDQTISNVILTGLGGSGIGGSIVENYVKDKLSVPFQVNKTYSLPKYIGPQTLVIVSSYSGHTEETLMAMNQALKAKCKVVCITSGGEVGEMAIEKGLDCILMPAGNPPRASIGYSLTQVLFVLEKTGLLSGDFQKEIGAAVQLLNAQETAIQRRAKELADTLFGKTPVFYAPDHLEGLAIRARQQINENSKMLSWHGVIPEMNHNELVGWKDAAEDKAVIIFRTPSDMDRIQTRMELNKEIIRKYTTNITELMSEGDTYFERIFYFIHLTDWLSWFLSDLRGQDATEVKVIDFLKGELAKI